MLDYLLDPNPLAYLAGAGRVIGVRPAQRDGRAFCVLRTDRTLACWDPSMYVPGQRLRAYVPRTVQWNTDGSASPASH